MEHHFRVLQPIENKGSVRSQYSVSTYLLDSNGKKVRFLRQRATNHQSPHPTCRKRVTGSWRLMNCKGAKNQGVISAANRINVEPRRDDRQ